MSAQEKDSPEKMVRMPRNLREMLREMKSEEENCRTYSEVIKQNLPKNTDDARLEIPEDEMVLVTVDEEIHELIHSLTGENITSYEVLLHFVVESEKSALVKPQTNNE